jgi:uncharacterized protein YyaL (SSP411 family)
MRPIEKNPEFTNPLVHSTSPYLKQHAHNPVFWYPWGDEPIARAVMENKPILISIGYSTCYWCHVMEREVFMNPSIAALMNEHFVNIKIDREEYPQLDEMYMVARQMMTREGGWPNNIFVTPDLKPFFAGGTFLPSDAPGRPGFPRVLEWLHYLWTAEQDDTKKTADEVAQAMREFLHYKPQASAPEKTYSAQADDLFQSLVSHYDANAGGFFQAPKFPHENYLQFLLSYHERTGNAKALEIVVHSLKRMAAGGIYDQVGCGFHRYAVDKEWYVPHFEKMLYTQAMLAGLYTDAARLTGNPWLADIAHGTLQFVLGPLTDGGGAFYAALDAETDGVEGEYYAWNAETLQRVLKPEEANFLVTFFALADIPAFPGHKHVNGQVLFARAPLDEAAEQHGMPYVQLAAMSGQMMNLLLADRNKRQSPNLDTKIIVSWNGLMIDALAHAGKVFSKPRYIEAARKAADYLLEHAIDNEGKLQRIVMDGRAQIDATLEDYAYMVKGLLTLSDVDAAASLMQRADELFYDAENGGYFYTQDSSLMPVRIKSGDDSTLPNANAIMVQNLLTLHAMTGQAAYRERAESMSRFFLSHNPRVLSEMAVMVQSALLLGDAGYGRESVNQQNNLHNEYAQITAIISPAEAGPGDRGEILVTLALRDGWHVNADRVVDPLLVPTQLDVQGKGVELKEILFPESEHARFSGTVRIIARVVFTGNYQVHQPVMVRLRFQPCSGDSCQKVQDISLSL